MSCALPSNDAARHSPRLSTPTHSPRLSPPAAADRPYLGGVQHDRSSGFVEVLDAATGKPLATHELPSRVTECGLAAAAAPDGSRVPSDVSGLDVHLLVGEGLKIAIPGDDAILIHVR